MRLITSFSQALALHMARRRVATVRLLASGLLLIGLTSMPRAVLADCGFSQGTAPTVSFNAGTITMQITAQPSTTTPIWQSQVITPPGNTLMSCNQDTTNGIAQSIAGPPTGSDNTLFPTNVPGISYRLSHVATTTYNMPSFANNTTASGNYQMTGTTQLLLYYTGPYLPPNGGTISGNLAEWDYNNFCTDAKFYNDGTYRSCRSSLTTQPVEFFKLNANIIVNVPTCNVGTSANGGPSNFTFTLPSVTTGQLASNPTPGLTPINLPLVNCPTGQKVFITLNTSAPYTTGGVNGVIAPSGAGYAAGVGVQLLQANGTTPVTFGTTFGGSAIGGTGIATGSNFTINLFARYYTTGSVTAGPVQGVATYTLNYQ